MFFHLTRSISTGSTTFWVILHVILVCQMTVLNSFFDQNMREVDTDFLQISFNYFMNINATFEESILASVTCVMDIASNPSTLMPLKTFLVSLFTHLCAYM